MVLKANHDLRIYAATAGVYLWRVAEAYGVSYVTLNSRMRNEFDKEHKEEFKAMVDKIIFEEK